MSDAVLISIRPKWCELIASGEKTIEVRKTRPKIETPFKCYIYETKNRDNEIYKRYKVDDIKCGKVIGEFVCDEIYKCSAEFVESPEDTYEEIRQIWQDSEGEECNAIIATNEQDNPNDCELCKKSCLSFDELRRYIGINSHDYPFYAWQISELKIYDKPRELGEFYIHKYDDHDYCIGCPHHECPDTEYPCCECLKDEINRAYLYRPPQSWMFVEEV